MMETKRIDITRMKVSEVDALGRDLNGNWRIKRFPNKKGGYTVWLIKDEPPTIRAEDVERVI
jgi:hypothetical protein